jgi:CrcB protein
VTWPLVVLGAAVGAVLRYLLDVWANPAGGRALPLGTLLANGTGTLLAGVVAGAALPGAAAAAVGIGVAGSLTTYSTFGYEAFRRDADGVRPLAVGYVVVTLAVGVLAVMAGTALGGLLGGAVRG